MDKRLIHGFSRYYTFSSLQKDIGERLIALCSSDFHNILEIGCGDGNFTRMLKERFAFARIISLDASEKMVNLAKKGIQGVNFIVADGEMLPLNVRFDLIVSNASFQWFDSLKKSLVKFKDNLSLNSVLLFSIFGRNTLKELSKSLYQLFKDNIKIRAGRFPSKEQIEEILKETSPNFLIKDISIKKEYSCLMELLLSIRYSSSFNKMLWTKGMIERLDRVYRNKFNGIFATYEVFLVKIVCV